MSECGAITVPDIWRYVQSCSVQPGYGVLRVLTVLGLHHDPSKVGHHYSSLDTTTSSPQEQTFTSPGDQGGSDLHHFTLVRISYIQLGQD